jgi:hypothetical protein
MKKPLYCIFKTFYVIRQFLYIRRSYQKRYSCTYSQPQQQMEVSGELHAPAALLPGKSPNKPLNTRLGGPLSQSERFEEQKNFGSCQDWSPVSQSRYYTCSILLVLWHP